jgi:hypothetical protein
MDSNKSDNKRYRKGSDLKSASDDLTETQLASEDQIWSLRKSEAEKNG